jgi:hypothetical protein
VVAVGEALKRGLAGVAGGRHQHEVIVGELASALLECDAFREEHRHALKRHVFECRGGPVPELKYVHSGYDFFDGRNARVVEVLAVCGSHELSDARVRQVYAKALEDERRALPVRHLGKGEYLFQPEAGKFLGHVEPAAVSDAFDNGVAEPGTGGVESACVAVAHAFHACMVADRRRCGRI